ncbi:hypothetical protein ACFE04_009725 [Oxalis oulophora]
MPVVEEEAATSPAKDVSDRGEDVIVDGCEVEPIVSDRSRPRPRERQKHRWTHHNDNADEEDLGKKMKENMKIEDYRGRKKNENMQNNVVLKEGCKCRVLYYCSH